MMTTHETFAVDSVDVDQLLAEAAALRGTIGGDLALSAVAQPTVTRNRNSTRDRRQTEVQFLRRHITELEDELKRLQLRREQGHSVITKPKDCVTAWQRLAQRQQLACARSKLENASLRHQVKCRAQQIRSIQQLLYDDRRATSLEIAPKSLWSAGGDDATMFAELKRQAASAFTRTDRVIEQRGVQVGDSHITKEFDPVQCQVVVYLASTFEFPFDVHTTTVALWDALAMMYSLHHSPLKDPNCGDSMPMSHSSSQHDAVRVEERSGSMYAVSYVAQLSVDGVATSVRVRDLVTRAETMDTTNKSVIVWQTAVDSSSISDASSAPVISSGWLVVQQRPGACRSTVLQSVFEFRSPSTADVEKNPMMEALVLLAKACVEEIVLHVDKTLLH